MVAGHRAREPPDPIPNSEVKPRSVPGFSAVFGRAKPGKPATTYNHASLLTYKIKSLALALRKMERGDLEGLLLAIKKLKNTKIRDLVKTRIEEFKENGEKPSREIFKELCFCILTANFNAERCIKIFEELNDEFLSLSERELAEKLRILGHRYPRTRAKYIVEARRYAGSLKNVIENFKDENKLREWLVKNVRGVGYKEASHFLRNIGFINLAIIDYHIINILARHKLIEKPKTITRNRYFEIENLLRKIAEKLGLTLAELDLYLWYLETGKVLK